MFRLYSQASLTCHFDGIHVSFVEKWQFTEVNSAAVAVITRNGLSHCQYTGAGGLVQVGGGDEDGVTIVSQQV